MDDLLRGIFQLEDNNKTVSGGYHSYPHGTIEKGVSTLGQSTVPQYPVAAFPAWPPDASSQGAYSPDFHYPSVDPGNDFHLQPQGSQYDVMSPCPPLETNIYGAAGPGGPGEVYTSKITSSVNYETPLLVAAAANQPKIVKDLILLGADVNAMDQKGQTVLHLGATYGLPSVIEAVMMTGAPVNVEARNFEGLTPLHCAVMAHNAAFQTQNMEPLSQHHLQPLLLCIQRLLQLGADYKSQDLKSSKTILHLAVQAANLPLVQFLLKLPGQERQNFVNIKAHGNTALHMAAGLHGHPYQEQIVRLLLDHWADPTARNPENEQPVHLLTTGPAAEQLRLLLRSRRSGPGLVYPPSFT
ncbi:NF-kappa-B inhibitor delta [Notechis scutatus]|uniref:NF-kappa-B inhibitor delta n=1 Tax=Notechis scutatus TaxID=8663 RepID=A0A6J1VRE1_9SAUR|nr:NF-kappa-B inhibitor delta [Notechis scutatus]